MISAGYQNCSGEWINCPKKSSSSSGDKQKNSVMNQPPVWLLSVLVLYAAILIVAHLWHLSAPMMETLCAAFVAGCAIAAYLRCATAMASGRIGRTMAISLYSISMSALPILIALIPGFQTICLLWSRKNLPSEVIPPTKPCGTAMLERYSDL